MFNKWFNDKVLQLPSRSTNLKTKQKVTAIIILKQSAKQSKSNRPIKQFPGPRKSSFPIHQFPLSMNKVPTYQATILSSFSSSVKHRNAHINCRTIMTPIEPNKAHTWRNSAAQHTREINITLPTERNLISCFWSLARLSL